MQEKLIFLTFTLPPVSPVLGVSLPQHRRAAFLRSFLVMISVPSREQIQRTLPKNPRCRRFSWHSDSRLWRDVGARGLFFACWNSIITPDFVPAKGGGKIWD